MKKSRIRKINKESFSIENKLNHYAKKFKYNFFEKESIKFYYT
jgi:hypothetical protein